MVLVAIGRRPYTDGLNLEAIGVEKDKKGRIVIDDQFNTSAPGVKCIGDVTFGPMLAHKAEDEGEANCVSNVLSQLNSALTQVSPPRNSSNLGMVTSITMPSHLSFTLTLR